MAEPYVFTTRISVNLLRETDPRHSAYEIAVEYRGHGQWAVRHQSWSLGVDGHWDYEKRPSERDDLWIAAHRFDLDTALRLAKEQAPQVTLNGTTAADVLAGLATEEPTP